jgi:glycosyltransferase involved in cell wall biosynthesis
MIETKTARASDITAAKKAATPRLLYVATVSRSLRGFLLPFVQHFRELGWTVDGMARGISECADCLGAFDRVWEAPWSRNPFDPNNLAAAREIRRVASQGSYDIVHVHTPVASFVTRYALRRKSAPKRPRVIYTAHGFHFHPYGSPLKNAGYRKLEQIAGKWTDYLVTINHTDEQAAIESKIVPAQQVQYMPGIGIDTEHYSPELVDSADVARVRADLGISAEPMLLMLAEFIPRKRHADVLRAVANADRRDFHLALAGNGPTQQAMRALALELGIAGRVHFLGVRRDVPALIRASNAVLLPSMHEGLSRSVMEALSLEVAVIGARIRGIEDLVRDDAGLLVKPGDIAALSRAISWILDNPSEARRMGKIGRERMELFHTRRIIRAHEDLYARAIGAPRT